MLPLGPLAVICVCNRSFAKLTTKRTESNRASPNCTRRKTPLATAFSTPEESTAKEILPSRRVLIRGKSVSNPVYLNEMRSSVSILKTASPCTSNGAIPTTPLNAIEASSSLIINSVTRDCRRPFTLPRICIARAGRSTRSLRSASHRESASTTRSTSGSSSCRTDPRSKMREPWVCNATSFNCK